MNIVLLWVFNYTIGINKIKRVYKRKCDLFISEFVQHGYKLFRVHMAMAPVASQAK